MAALSLESFEAEAAQDDTATATFNEGYQQGFDASQAAAAADSTALAAALVQAISDIDFTYAEARAQVMQSLNPLFDALTTAVLPHCVSSGFTSQIASMLMTAAGADTEAPFRLHVHPDQVAAVEAATDNLPNNINILPDATLSLHAIWIERGARETHLDLDRLLAQITEALGAVAKPEHRTATHG